jgi:hypothetical protein
MVLIGLFLLAFQAGTFGREFLAADSCLDAGGSFDYSALVCDHRDSHPYVAYGERHPQAVSVTVLGALVLLAGVAVARVGGPVDPPVGRH